MRVRGEWCDYENWREPTYEEVIGIYTEVMEQTVYPILKSLVDDNGVIPIWQDVSPGGKINMTTGENFELKSYTPYYKLFPRMNEIGRRITIQAGGMVLPIWDLTMPRWQDHQFFDNTEFADGDELHWCAYHGPQSIPAVWTRLLSQVLFGDMLSVSNETYTATSRRRALRESQPQSNSLRKNKTSTTPAFPEDGQFVSLVASHQTDCPCSTANGIKHCLANIVCVWDETSGCTEREPLSL